MDDETRALADLMHDFGESWEITRDGDAWTAASRLVRLEPVVVNSESIANLRALLKRMQKRP